MSMTTQLAAIKAAHRRAFAVRTPEAFRRLALELAKLRQARKSGDDASVCGADCRFRPSKDGGCYASPMGLSPVWRSYRAPARSAAVDPHRWGREEKLIAQWEKRAEKGRDTGKLRLITIATSPWVHGQPMFHRITWSMGGGLYAYDLWIEHTGTDEPKRLTPKPVTCTRAVTALRKNETSAGDETCGALQWAKPL